MSLSWAPIVATALLVSASSALAHQSTFVDQMVRPVNITLPPGYDYCEAPRPKPEVYTPLANYQLSHLQILIRHGDRSPIEFTYDDDSVWNCDDSQEIRQVVDTDLKPVSSRFIPDPTFPADGPFSKFMWKGNCHSGQLTSKGFRQHKDLGAALRAIYVDELHYLPANYTDSALSTRTTDFWRTQQSAVALHTGLYPSVNRPVNDIIPINVIGLEVSTMTGHPEYCPRLKTLLTLQKSSAGHQAFLARNKALRDDLDHTLRAKEGIPFHADTFIPHFDVMMTKSCHNFKLPCSPDGRCATPEQTEKLLTIGAEEMALGLRLLPNATEIASLNGGPFLEKIRDDLLAANANPSAVPKLELHSAHDSTIQNTLALHESVERSWPPYASSFVIELWTPKPCTSNCPRARAAAAGSPLVRILYNGKPLETKWCDFAAGCPIETYINFLSSKIPADYFAACKE